VRAALSTKPSVIFVAASSSAVAAQIVVDARQAGHTGGVLGANAFNSPATAKAAGAAGAGSQSAAGWYLGNNSIVNEEFIRSYTQTYGSAPDQFAAQAFTGVLLLAAAAGVSPLTFTNTAADRTALKTALAGVSLNTPLGQFSFTPDHDVVQPVWVVAMTGKGGYKLVKKVPAAAAHATAVKAGTAS
jgi:branched-chain amino acid transport system substrate-binding protein